MSTVLFGVLSSVCACVRVCVREKLVSSVGARALRCVRAIRILSQVLNFSNCVLYCK